MRKKYKKKYKSDAKLADHNICLCKKCNRCWEVVFITYKNIINKSKKKKYIKYYTDFPTYGKKKKTCVWCKV